jgi:hypothetical protein
MQKRFLTVLKAAMMVLAAGVLITSCKRDFDQPPSFIEPNITPNTTIKALKAMHTIGAIRRITQDLVIAGVVVADDKSGNFYKSIAIQDETGGITVRLDGTNLNTTYPVGRKIYIKLNGLYMGDYNRLIQIGGGIDNTDPAREELAPIASTLFDTYILKGSFNNAVTPKVVTVAQLHDSLQSMLIQLNNMEFVTADTSKTYADVVTQSSRNLNVKGCGGSSVILRTSGFANFAGINVPNGNGTLLAVYTMFGNTKQLLIRDTSDVRFTGTRCGSGPTTVMNVSDVRALYTGSTTSAPDGRRITGVVISNRNTANLNDQNIILQQGNGLSGIIVRFDAAHPFDLGDSVDINISGQEISEFNNTLQVNNVPLGYATKVGTGKTITPRVATIAQVNTNFEAWESTLVQINNAALSGSGTYSGNVTLNDGTATIILRTSTSATFAGQSYPANAATLVGYLSEFGTTKQIGIRGTTDVVAGGGTGGTTGLNLTTSPFLLNFDNIASGLPQGVSVKVGATSSSLGSADAAVYNGSLAAGTAWSQFSLGVKNYASATGLTATSDAIAQDASTNRALGFRQTGTTTTGGDPGVAFVFQLPNTTGKTNLQLSFLLQSLDATATGRTTTWTVDYGIGDNPSSFTAVTTTPSPLTTAQGTFASTPVSVNFGSALNNVNQKVWIRIVALNATTGSSNRPSSAVDNFQLTWN